MTKNRLQVLVPLLLLVAPLASSAQPPDAPAAVAKPQPEPPKELPLAPLKLDDWLAQNGGLTRLKFKLDNVTAAEIADEVRKQSGVELVPEVNLRGAENDAPRFSVEATGQTFWEAVSSWNRSEKPDAPKLSLQRDWGTDRWRMVTWSSSQPGLRVLAGPCLLSASSLSVNHTLTRSLDPKDDPKTNPKADAPGQGNSMNVQCSMLIDPRLRPQILGLITQIDSAADDQNRAITVGDSYSQIWLDENNDYANLGFNAPERDAKRLRQIKGTLRLAVVTRREKWEVELSTKPDFKAEQSFKSPEAEVKVRIEGFESKMSGWSLRLHLERRETGPARIFKTRERSYGNEARLGSYNDTRRAVRLLNEEGEPIAVSMASARGGEDKGARTLDIELTTQRNEGDKDIEKSTPVKMALDLPMEWREVQAPFEFNDLPLP